MLNWGFFWLCVLLSVGEGTHGSEMAATVVVFASRGAKSARCLCIRSGPRLAKARTCSTLALVVLPGNVVNSAP
jgi:predicted glycosyltransferase